MSWLLKNNVRGQIVSSLHDALPPFLYASFMPYSTKHLIVTADTEQKYWGWKEGWGGWPHSALLCERCVGGEWRTEHFSLILPDSPGAWKVGVSLSGGEGGPAGAQELGYFCNTEHICSQPQRRSNSGRMAGMQGARRGWGELWFHPSGSLKGPCNARWGSWGYLPWVGWGWPAP